MTATTPPLSGLIAADDLAILAETFRLLGDPTRLRILLALSSEPRHVGAIAESEALSPSLVSHHLRLLRGARLVATERRGKQIIYRIHDEHVRQTVEDMITHVQEHVHEHASDQQEPAHAPTA